MDARGTFPAVGLYVVDLAMSRQSFRYRIAGCSNSKIRLFRSARAVYIIP